MTFTLHNASDNERTAQDILAAFPHTRVFALHGELGAGKTTLTKGFCQALGVKDQMSSPTFTLVNEYRSEYGGPLYHFDLYRLKDANELEGIGFTEYVDSGCYCFIEWPELAEDLLPEDAVRLSITAQPDGSRSIQVSP